MEGVLGLGSPFPWAPGHVWAELEWLCYKKLESRDNRPYFYFVYKPEFLAVVTKYMAEKLSRSDIHIISDWRKFGQALTTLELIDISISHVKFVKREDIPSLHYKPQFINKNFYIYVDEAINGHNASLRSYIISNEVVHADYNEYIKSYPIGTDLMKSLNNKSPSIDYIKSLKESQKPIALINIRERAANGSCGMPVKYYKPLIHYLIDNNYKVLDISHDEKSKTLFNELNELGVICYWASDVKSPSCDFELMSNSEFYIGSGGISHLALLLRLPMLWVGYLYPVHLCSEYGYQIPCRLRDVSRGHELNSDQLFDVYLKLPELWENKYDSFLNKYGEGNMHNCIDFIESKYVLQRPSPHRILDGFIQLEKDVKAGENKYNISTSSSKDLYNRNHLYWKIFD